MILSIIMIAVKEKKSQKKITQFPVYTA